jgi:hypothetical protein
MRLTSMISSRLKSENGLPLRWPTSMGSSTSMCAPSPVGTLWTRASYTWTTARSSTNARSINLVSNPIQRLSPNGTSTFPQTHEGDSPAGLRIHHSSLDDSWSHWHGAVRPWSGHSTVKPWRHAIRVTSTGKHARRTIDARRRLEGFRAWYSSDIPVLTGTMTLVPFEGTAAEDPCHGIAHVRRDRI